MKFKIAVILLSLCVVIGFPAWERFRPQRIAIVYIATGRYIDFWDTFYVSAEKNFVPEMKKHYFVMTDDTKRTFPKNVTRIYLKQMEWPYITLLRYHFVDWIKDKIKPYDYAFFFNANAVIVSKLGPEILPDETHRLVATKHPAFYDEIPEKLPFEYNVKSKAYVPLEWRKNYFQTGFSGGRTDAYLAMNAELKERTIDDLKNGIIAWVHDESHYNWFMSQKNPVILGPNYIFGTGLEPAVVEKFAPEMKIIMLNKASDLFGGHACMRGQEECPRPYDYRYVEGGHLRYLIHPWWSDWYEFKSSDKACLFNSDICASIKTLENGLIRFDWDDGGSSNFRKTDVDFVLVWDSMNE